MLDPVITSEGVAVVHLFCTRTPGTDDEAVIAAVKAAQADDVQVVTVAVLGHKAELCFMALHPDSWKLRDLQDRSHQRWPGRGRQLRLDHRGVRVRPGCPRRNEEHAALSGNCRRKGSRRGASIR